MKYEYNIYTDEPSRNIQENFTGIEGHRPACPVQFEEQTVLNGSYNSDPGLISSKTLLIAGILNSQI